MSNDLDPDSWRKCRIRIRILDADPLDLNLQHCYAFCGIKTQDWSRKTEYCKLPEQLVYLGCVGVLTGQLQEVVGPGRGASLRHLNSYRSR